MDIAIREAVTEYWSILSGAWPRDDDQGSARQQRYIVKMSYSSLENAIIPKCRVQEIVLCICILIAL